MRPAAERPSHMNPAFEGAMSTAIVLFTRDLRVRDHPALATAAREADRVVPLFVLDERIRDAGFVRPNRAAFLLDTLRDLDGELRERGAGLVVRQGDVVRETMAVAEQVGARAIHLSADVSAYATARERRLRRACRAARRELHAHPGVTVVPPGELTPAEGDHFRVFTPYMRRWEAAGRRPCERAPRRLALPPDLAVGRAPERERLGPGRLSPELPSGGPRAGQRLLEGWLRRGVEEYAERNDALPEDGTSRLSPYLHFGCVSPLEAAERAAGTPGGDAFVRQLCWRDFHHQVHAVVPGLPREDYNPRGDRWRDDEEGLARWREGRTGFPIVDAGMRQLVGEGWMHNRARLITGSFLTKDLYVDWRAGAAHFWDLLVDGDLANNAGNWQWVAGTGNDTRPHRMFNPLRQAERFDPRGDYVRRWVPELAGVKGKAVHEPWNLPDEQRRALDYPDPMLDHAEAVRRFRAARAV